MIQTMKRIMQPWMSTMAATFKNEDYIYYLSYESFMKWCNKFLIPVQYLLEIFIVFQEIGDPEQLSGPHILFLLLLLSALCLLLCGNDNSERACDKGVTW